MVLQQLVKIGGGLEPCRQLELGGVNYAGHEVAVESCTEVEQPGAQQLQSMGGARGGAGDGGGTECA